MSKGWVEELVMRISDILVTGNVFGGLNEGWVTAY